MNTIVTRQSKADVKNGRSKFETQCLADTLGHHPNQGELNFGIQ